MTDTDQKIETRFDRVKRSAHEILPFVLLVTVIHFAVMTYGAFVAADRLDETRAELYNLRKACPTASKLRAVQRRGW